MQITVEIGTKEQQQEIINELGMLGEASKHYTMAFRIKEIIVPKDFDATVTELQKAGTYKSVPGMEPVSKAIFTPQGHVLLFHPNIFSAAYDNHIRYAIYWHEFTLLVNKGHFPVLTRHKLDRYANYFMNLYQLYDQYTAARKSFEFRDAVLREVLKEELSDLAKEDLERSLLGSLAIIRNKAEYYDWFRFQIMEYREKQNINDFLGAVRGKIAQLSYAIIFAYATMDHYESLREKESLIAEAPMLDNNTRAFLEYFRYKFQEDAVDLSDGIDLMEAFWANFGIRFVDGEKCMECEVVDI